MNTTPFPPTNLLLKVRRINGFLDLKFPTSNLMEFVLETCEDYSDWPEDQGFGSSDGTYAAKRCIDDVINSHYNGEYETKFTPFLSVVKIIK